MPTVIVLAVLVVLAAVFRAVWIQASSKRRLFASRLAGLEAALDSGHAVMQEIADQLTGSNDALRAVLHSGLQPDDPSGGGESEARASSSEVRSGTTSDASRPDSSPSDWESEAPAHETNMLVVGHFGAGKSWLLSRLYSDSVAEDWPWEKTHRNFPVAAKWNVTVGDRSDGITTQAISRASEYVMRDPGEGETEEVPDEAHLESERFWISYKSAHPDHAESLGQVVKLGAIKAWVISTGEYTESNMVSGVTVRRAGRSRRRQPSELGSGWHRGAGSRRKSRSG